MKNLNIIIILFVLGLFGSCVDDYQDANPPSLLDGPYYTVSLSTDTISGGESLTFSINVIDAPGGIDTVEIRNPFSFGSYSFDNLNEMVGKQEGEITGQFNVPSSFEGKLTLSFELFDQQTDEEGEDAAKSLLVEKAIVVEYPGEPSEFSVTPEADEFVRGETVDMTIEITNAPGGIDTVYASANSGSVEFDPTSYANAVGKTSATITASYVSDDDFTGDVVVTISVVDKLQERISSEDVNLTANYMFDAPVVDLTIAETEFKAYNEIDLSVDITASGTIDTVMIESFASGTSTELGSATFGEDEVNDAIGNTSGTVEGTFISDTKGFINVKVTVVDEQGRMTSDSVEVLVRPCATADLAGTYRVVSSGESADAPTGPYVDLIDTVEVSGSIGNNFDVSDITFGLYELQGYSDEPGSFVTCDDSIVSGEGEESITVTSGTINMDGSLVIEWESAYGDTGTSVLTPIP